MVITISGTQVQIIGDLEIMFQHDNLVHTLAAVTDKDESWEYNIDIEIPSEKRYNSIIMTRNANMLSVDLTRQMLPYDGRYVFQFRGTNKNGAVYHTDKFNLWIKDSIDLNNAYNPMPSSFYQLEQYFKDNVQKVEDIADKITSGEYTGATFTPIVSEDGELSWTNNGGLENPEPVNIKGPQGYQGTPGKDGEAGPQGIQGVQGNPGTAATITVGSVTKGDNPSVTNSGNENQAVFDFVLPKGDKGDIGESGPRGEQGSPGFVFTPSVSTEGVISWTNDGSLDNPTPINIKGPKGDTGNTGPQGPIGLTGEQGPPGTAGKDAPYYHIMDAFLKPSELATITLPIACSQVFCAHCLVDNTNVAQNYLLYLSNNGESNSSQNLTGTLQTNGTTLLLTNSHSSNYMMIRIGMVENE
jgi:hypothetical protein